MIWVGYVVRIDDLRFLNKKWKLGGCLKFERRINCEDVIDCKVLKLIVLKMSLD